VAGVCIEGPSRGGLVFWKFYARELKLTRSHFEDLESMDDVSFRPRLCENALNTSKVESYGRCLRNQQTDARIALVSYIGVRKCCLGCVSGPNSHSRTTKRLDSRPDRFKQS
jgi:hypothetical protein